MKCFWCEAELEQRGGGNIAVHFVCPNGCGAWWPEKDGVTNGEILWRSEQAYKRMLAAKRGGGSSGRKRKKKQKRKQPHLWPDWRDV